ncbi:MULTISPECIES: DEAD/DEAH box helicase [unclassified Modestobacter]|uniref:DEAD/DEAH box helicase n=1 Tax=unclassified Modestobacter TaxID=2643866 RepID=UPI0022AA6089|nr:MULTISPECIES: DEAD/DEAH box helicase [unclassified Modestobacter]MCZ2823845.1 DEAD/DEAH box helicase [Modestobacter sp. VKM Ac-2981]MCZ2852090.1 DEAD/DEAH box helicase [Modestobacter sp. VKM Ac-2982]
MDRTSRNRPRDRRASRATLELETEFRHRRRTAVPHQTEARELTSTENTATASSTPAAPELEHAETGAPAPEELEQQVEELGGAPVAPDSPLFSDFDVHPDIVAALAEVGITRTFAIQELTLPLALAGNDLIGQARTGTGKTLGFGVPLLQRVVPPAEGGDGVPQALVVVPTRELCVQVSRDLSAAGAKRGIRVQAIYGGRAFEPQVAALQAGVEVVVGTPGRLLDLAQRGDLILGKVRGLVLDEADEMLDLGFLPDIERILAMVPDKRQTMLFSATMPGPIVTLSRSFMTQPTHIRAHGNDEGSTVPQTTQFIYRAHNLDKPELLSRVLQSRDRGLVMVFCRTKRTAQKVADELVDRGFAAAAVHGDLGQGAREQALRAFRAGKVDVLVATDVAARGIDVTGVSHVVNYQCPEDEKTYVHRIGRTGRAGSTGVAVTLVDWDDIPRWQLINKALDLDFADPPETYSTSPWVYSDLDVPTTSTGRLPRAQRTREGLGAETLEDLGETGKRQRAGGTSSGPGRSSSPAEDDQPTAGPPKSRPRQRTRGNGAAAAGAAAAIDGPGAESGSPAMAASTDGGEGGRPRRRRRRGGRGGSGGGGAEPSA